MAERATLIQQEQTSFINVVTAYAWRDPGACRSWRWNVNNEQVLAKQLQADQRPLPRRRDHPHRRRAG